jgi:asparagine synthase (glutamine-hydrolysing)
MCGLAGLARVGGRHLEPADVAALHRMTDLLAHRGPDEQRHLHEGAVGLSFTRLSLVDPEGGGQPLTSEDGQVVLIANGEIYNHRELTAGLPAGTRMRTGSDCEVLVHLYQRRGLEFLADVRGMFGLILWDAARRRLVLARDRFGVKPLYFAQNAERTVAASEIKALFELADTPRRLDWTAALADQILTAEPYLTDQPPTTWFAGVESVPPAGLVVVDVDTGRTTRSRYWEPRVPPETHPVDLDRVHDDYFALLESAVSETLMADVEIGLFLSGGIDSAAVAALAGRHGEVHCFTAVTASTLLNGDVEFAHRTARHLGLPHHPVLFPADRVPTVGEWRSLLWLLETPLCGPEQWFKYELHRYARTTRPGIKAMLLGAAADEYSGGYSTLLSPDGTWAGFERAVAGMSRAAALRRRPELASWWADGEPPLLNPGLLGGEEDPRDDYQRFVAWKMRDIDQYNCWQEDRTAAGNGIEARVPFLDHRLVDMLAAIPPEQRAALVWDKELLRAAVQRRNLLPEAVVRRPKEPFYDGRAARHTHRIFLAMLGQESGELVDQALSAPGAKDHLDPDGVTAALRRLREGRGRGHVEVLLRVLNLGLLDGMLADLPAPLPVHPGGVELRVLRGADWAELRVDAEQCLPPEPDWPSLTPALREETFLVRRPETGEQYVVQAGELRFVLDETENGLMIALLGALDGRREVRAVAAGLGVPVDDLVVLLRQAVDGGVVALAP